MIAPKSPKGDYLINNGLEPPLGGRGLENKDVIDAETIREHCLNSFNDF